MFRNLEKLRAALAKMPDAARARVDPNTGRFRAPEFSGRVVGELRKAVIANGVDARRAERCAEDGGATAQGTQV